MAFSPSQQPQVEASNPTDVVSLDAAYAIMSEMRGVYKNALAASNATNRGLAVAARVRSSPAFAFLVETI